MKISPQLVLWTETLGIWMMRMLRRPQILEPQMHKAVFQSSEYIAVLFNFDNFLFLYHHLAFPRLLPDIMIFYKFTLLQLPLYTKGSEHLRGRTLEMDYWAESNRQSEIISCLHCAWDWYEVCQPVYLFLAQYPEPVPFCSGRRLQLRVASRWAMVRRRAMPESRPECWDFWES